MKRTLIVISILVCSFGGKAMADYDQLKEELDAYQEEIQGRIFTFRPQRFLLSDGTELIMSRGTPAD